MPWFYLTQIIQYFAGGVSIHRLYKLQKKAIRNISLSKYNAHTEPLFKSMKLLKVQDIFHVNALKFTYKYHNKKLPLYFDGMLDNPNPPHDYNTRYANHHIPMPNRSTSKKSIRYFLPIFLEETPDCICDKFLTHSPSGFNIYAKNHFISQYRSDCDIENCYICRSNPNAQRGEGHVTFPFESPIEYVSFFTKLVLYKWILKPPKTSFCPKTQFLDD